MAEAFRKAGVVSALDIASGAILHTFAAALVAASATAFLTIKLVGAGCLICLGGRMLFAKPTASSLQSAYSSPRFFPAYHQGLLVNILNPKVALFFLAFMPQFISAGSADTFLALIALGTSFVFISLIWCFCLYGFPRLLWATGCATAKGLLAESQRRGVIHLLGRALGDKQIKAYWQPKNIMSRCGIAENHYTRRYADACALFRLRRTLTDHEASRRLEQKSPQKPNRGTGDKIRTQRTLYRCNGKLFIN